MGSTRLPGKVMREIEGKPVLRWTVDAVRAAHSVDLVVLATSNLLADDVIAAYCASEGIECFRGSESDVLDRFYQCALQYEADIILRFTADCVFLDPYIIDQVVQLRAATNAAYCSNQPTFADGLDTEVFTFKALETAWKEATRPTDRDCTTQYIIRNQDRFPAEYLVCPFPGWHKERWVLDTQKDYDFCSAIANRWGKKTPPSCMDIIRILDKEPHLREINAGAVRNERFYEGLAAEQLPPRTYTRSNELLDRATKTIPFGSQTFSKSHLFYPVGSSPLYVSHGEGARIFDVDGQDYVDLVNGLLPVVLGYRDPDVDDAVRRQLNRAGMSFSLATRLESELAEKLIELIPCAEMVKFGKTGTDVTTAAVRLARAYTGKQNILYSGYHGWADWSIARTFGKNHGVLGTPHSQPFVFGDKPGAQKLIQSWHPAAVVVEPTDNKEFLHWLRQECNRFGALLIFDEIQTGFRYSMGGAQGYFEVKPDLACFGKSMANGMPISALVGKRDIMKMMDGTQGMFYSGTFFGDTLSIAAALATIDKMQKENVIHQLWIAGSEIKNAIIANPRSKYIEFSGVSPLTKLKFKDARHQALFTQVMAANGVLALNANGVSYAIKGPEIEQIIRAYNKALEAIDQYVQDPKTSVAELKGQAVR